MSAATSTRWRLAAAVACVLLLAGLVALEQAGLATPVDVAGDAAFAPLRTHAVLAAALWITVIGVEGSRFAVLLTSSALLWSEGRSRLLRPLWVTVVGSEVTTWVLKFLIARPRPVFLPGVATATSPSFPSAHAAGTMALYGALALLIAASRPTRGQRAVIGLLAALLIATIGMSRLVLNVHFPSDVASGFLVGGFWLLIGSFVDGRRRSGPRAGGDRPWVIGFDPHP